MVELAFRALLPRDRLAYGLARIQRTFVDHPGGEGLVALHRAQYAHALFSGNTAQKTARARSIAQ